MSTPKPPSQTGCVWFEECVEICATDPVWVEERGARATFRNPDKLPIRKVHYDKCAKKNPALKGADFIVGIPGQIDVIVELKGTDTNLRGGRGADTQIESTLLEWLEDERRAPRIAALIVYGKIVGKKRLPGRCPRAESNKQAIQVHFLAKYKMLVLVHESGERQFHFRDFKRKKDH